MPEKVYKVTISTLIYIVFFPLKSPVNGQPLTHRKIRKRLDPSEPDAYHIVIEHQSAAAYFGVDPLPPPAVDKSSEPSTYL